MNPELLSRLDLRLNSEMKKEIHRQAEEAGLKISTFIRRHILDPWYISQITQCHTIKVSFMGDAEIIRVEIDNVPTKSN